MSHQQDLDFRFSEKELAFYKRFRVWRDALLGPVARRLARAGVKPDTLSYLGVLMVLPFIYFFGFHPWFALIFLVLNLLFDGLDGAVARELAQVSVKGQMLDMFCDYVSFFVFMLTFEYFGLVDGFWTTVFLLSFVVAQALISFGILKGVKIFPVVRPKFVMYLVFVVWLATGQNFFDPLLVFWSVYLVITDLFLFSRIRWAL